ncbi:GGDEF domain-containing protein [Vibrio neonatus]|uniref:GGDEF domain-containing protein n=1 Tax=Vibrio neonatus TaxID=278860 RepID=UPI0021C321CE|nr:GGDEF domain-containing protein [Vibrio neonatus]
MNSLFIGLSVLLPTLLFACFDVINTTDFILEAIAFILLCGIFVYGHRTLDITVNIGLIALITCEFFECLEAIGEFQWFFQNNVMFDVVVSDILSIAGLMLIAFGIHKMFRYQRRVAEIEPLTNLFNKRAIEGLSKKELDRAKRSKNSTSLILIDLDHFKMVNDTYGHQVGDEVLIGVAKHLSHLIRRYDLLGRWGGDEFIILCPNTNKTEANEVMTRLHKPLSIATAQTTIDITFSIGSTTVDPKTNMNFNALFVQADKALYAVKKNGRNNLCHFDSLCSS